MQQQKPIGDLSTEQEFELTKLQFQAESMKLDELKQRLVEIFVESMHQDNEIKRLIKESLDGGI